MQVGIAAGTDADRHILPAVLEENLGQCRRQENWYPSHRYLRQLRLHRRQGAVRVKIPDQKSVACQAMPSRIQAGNHAGHVNAGHRGKNRVVILERYSIRGQGRKIGHQPGIHLCRLESIENEDHC